MDKRTHWMRVKHRVNRAVGFYVLFSLVLPMIINLILMNIEKDNKNDNEQ